MQLMWDKLHKNHKLDEDATRILEYLKRIMKFYFVEHYHNLSKCGNTSSFIKLYDLPYLKTTSKLRTICLEA